MRRRALLAALSTTCVAGCLSDGGGSDGSTRSDRDETAGTETTAVSFSVDAPGDYRAVATLPDLGDREVNRTATTRWSVGSVDTPGTILVTVTADSLRVTTE